MSIEQKESIKKMNNTELLKCAKIVKKCSELQDAFSEKGDLTFKISVEIEGVMTEGDFYLRGNTQLIVFKPGERSIFVFPKSYGKEDWKDNLNFVMQKGVHQGFLNQYLSVATIIYNNISEKNNLFIGWSLGGALVTLAAYAGRLTNNSKFVTFGQPRVVNRKRAKLINNVFKENYFRVVNPNDPVCKVPFRWLWPLTWFGFVHVGTKVKIGKNKFIFKVLKFWCWGKWRHSDKMNHHIDEYIKLLG